MPCELVDDYTPLAVIDVARGVLTVPEDVTSPEVLN
jgi:hypothetical protein